MSCHTSTTMIMNGVREYSEGMDVNFAVVDGRACIIAFNEAGYNQTRVDLQDLLTWLKDKQIEIIEP